METIKDIGDLSNRSKFIYSNTMMCLLKALEGKRIKVDIRNDSVVQGNLILVDSSMGLNMTKVLMTNVMGHSTHLDLFYIQGRNIRYVHIPDEVDILRAMNWQLNKSTVYKESEKIIREKLIERRLRRQKKQCKNKLAS